VSAWTPAGSMSVAGHESGTATLLSDGRVLVAGGTTQAGFGTTPTRTAELFDPSTSTWTLTAPMSVARVQATATPLDDGRILVVGGTSNGPEGALAGAELYDPQGGGWSATGSLTQGRRGQIAVRLHDGRVLVAGGTSDMPVPPLGKACCLASVEIYDPASGSWSEAAPMSHQRYGAAATVLPDGRVLVAGGADAEEGTFHVQDSAELYDPGSDTWTAASAPLAARYGATAVTLPDGRMLVLGGANLDSQLASSELFDPATMAWTAGPALPVLAGYGVAARPDGTVVLVGGGDGVFGTPGTAAAAYLDPATDAVVDLDPMSVARVGPLAVTLADGSVLVAGGTATQGFAGPLPPGWLLSSAERLAPPRPLATTTALSSSANPSVLGDAVTLSATVSASSSSTLPSGEVRFLDGDTLLGTASLASGTATLAVSTLQQGTHPITAEYEGDTTFAGSTSAVLDQLVIVTPAALCSITTSDLDGSGRAGAAGVAAGICAQLQAIQSASTPAQRARLVARFETRVDALETAGWLTPPQADELRALARSL